MAETERELEFSTYHPIVNFVYFTAVIGITMFSMNLFFLAAGFLISWIYSFMLSGKKSLKYNILFLLPVFIFMVIINPIFYNNGETVLFYINNNRVTLETVIFGIAQSILLLNVVIWFRCYSILLTSDKLIYLFGRFVPSLALIISMVFRFIPLLRNRYQEITYGQMGMGRCRKKESLKGKCRRIIKQLSILIAWSLEASIETADSMEARGYGIKGRTSFHLFSFRKRDAVLLGVILLLTGIIISGSVKGSMDISYFPVIKLPEVDGSTYLYCISYLMLLTLPIGIELEGARKWKQYNLNI